MTDEEIVELGKQLRIDSIRAAAAAGSGHPTSSMSAADLIAVLLAKHLRYDFQDPSLPNNDHPIFSKGHASPLLYSAFKAVGVITDEQLLSFRKFGSLFEGHPTPILPWVDVATGSLGQGMPIGVGVAISGKYLEKLPYHVWVLCGDSEMAEGSIWEAFEQAGHLQLENLTVIIDVNRLGQRGPTMHQWELDAFANRATAFDWLAIKVDGHDPAAIDRAMAQAKASTLPTAIIAKTKKGSGVRSVEDQNGWHGRPLDHPEEAIAELGGLRNLTIKVASPEARAPHSFSPRPVDAPAYDVGAKVSVRKAFGDALAALGAVDTRVVAIDAEVGNSTYTLEFSTNTDPDRFFEMYIAEQQMLATAVGLQVRGWKPFAATFAAFFTRAYDFVRMAAISRANLRLCGTHAGVSIGQDGPSQMGLEDLAAFRAIHGSTVLYPSDANQTVQLVNAMSDTPGIVYLRATRGDTPVLYDATERFEIGGSRVLRATDADAVTVLAAGITLHEALKAADMLEGEGTSVRVVDLYSVKPLDLGGVLSAVEATEGRVVIVEDHRPEGGLGEAVLSGLAEAGRGAHVDHLAVRDMPTSGSPAELMQMVGIDADAIVAAVRGLHAS